MNTKNQTHTPSIVAGIIAVLGFFLATVAFGQPDGAQRLKTIDELPAGAHTLNMANGKELYFADGQLFAIA